MEVLRGRFRGSNRLTRARVLILMAFSGLLLYHALRSSRVGVCERDVFGHGGVQFQANVLPRVSGGNISRSSVWRGPNTAHTVRWRCGEIGQTCERGGESGGG